MTERLWCISELPLRDWIPLLTEKSNVVAKGQQPFEQLNGGRTAAGSEQGINEPERTGQENPLAARQTLGTAAGVVAQNEAVLGEAPLDSIDRGDDARVVTGQKADPADQ